MTDLAPVMSIELVDPQGNLVVFDPQPDVSPFESVLLSQLFIKLVLNRTGALPDWPAYVSRHGLWRHFTAPELNAATLDAQTPKPIVVERRTDDASHRMTILEGMPIPEGYTVIVPEAA